MAAAGSATALGAALLVGAPANAAPAGAASIQCRVDNWMSGTLQFVTYSNCATYPVNKRAIIGGDVGPCVTVPPLEDYYILHSRYAPGPYSPRPYSVEAC